MQFHRFSDLVNVFERVEAPAPSAGFMLCPAALYEWQGSLCSWQQVYEAAYAQARAVVQPSLLERWQRVHPN